MTTYLVTGGAGFIGSTLVRRLRQEHPRSRIIVIDNYTSGSTSFDPSDDIEVIKGDVVSPSTFNDLPDDVTRIYHLACPASPPAYQRDPVQTFRTAVLGTFNALSWATEHDARILVASTSEIYGDPQVHPQSEQYWGHVNPNGLRSCYDEGKRGGETLAADFRRQYGTDVRVVRIFNTYGPGMRVDDGRVVSNFAWSVLRRKPLTVYGDGQQTRSFCYVDDLVDGLTALMDTTVELPLAVNLGNPHEVTVGELAQLVVCLTGFDNIEYRPLPSDDPTRRRPDITVATELLGWTPRTPLETGFLNTLNDFARRTGHYLPFGAPNTGQAA